MHSVVRCLLVPRNIVNTVLMISSVSLQNMIALWIMMLLCSSVALIIYPTLKLLDGSALPDVAKRGNMILWVYCNLRVTTQPRV